MSYPIFANFLAFQTSTRFTPVFPTRWHFCQSRCFLIPKCQLAHKTGAQHFLPPVQLLDRVIVYPLSWSIAPYLRRRPLIRFFLTPLKQRRFKNRFIIASQSKTYAAYFRGKSCLFQEILFGIRQNRRRCRTIGMLDTHRIEGKTTLFSSRNE